MPNQRQSFPADVQSALQRGKTIDAIKLLRVATGLGLKDAKDVIDACQSGKPATLRQAFIKVSTALHEDVLTTLKYGNKIEAIKLLREQTGMRLKEAKDAVDEAGTSVQISPPVSDNQSPGKVTSSSGANVWVVFAIIAALVAYYFVVRPL
jgi:ribosomal protein L7/L12